MRIRRNPVIHPGFLYLAPVVNVLLVLLFFFMLSSAFLLQPGVEVRVPPSPFLLTPKGTPQIVSVTGTPHSAIFFQDAEVSPEELRTLLTENTHRGRTLILKADETAPYRKVAEVMNLALELGFSTILAGHGSE